MKLAILIICLLNLSTNRIYCDTLDGSSETAKPVLKILTLSRGLAGSEALARFERRAVFDGFKEGTTLKIIQPRKFPITKSEKVELINIAIKKLASDSKKNGEIGVILYMENELSLILTNPNEILSSFQSTGARILFPGDSTNECWATSGARWIDGSEEENNILNSAAFVGYSEDLVPLFDIESTSLPALFRAAFADLGLRTNLNLQIDSTSQLFTTLYWNSAYNQLQLKLNKDGRFLIPQLMNTNTSKPVQIVLTNLCRSGNSISYLNSLGSYLTPTLPEDKIELLEDDDAWPVITLAIFIEKATPFMEEFFEHIEELEYNKKKLHLFIHNRVEYNSKHVEAFLEKNRDFYASVKYIKFEDRASEWAARKLAVHWTIEEHKSDYLFSIDSVAHFDEETTLKQLIESNKLIIAPMLCIQTEFLPNICNWWGSLSRDGYYAKTTDFDEIAEDNHKGIWNAPFINAAYLIKAEILKNEETKPNFIHGLADPDIAFAYNNRARGIFMHVTNEFHPGHLINNQHFDPSHKNNELYELFDNRHDWENRYIHPNHTESLKENYEPLEPCKDVFWYPIVTPRFAKEMIEEMEHYGKWADGSIEARGDLYPTVDIQMNEIGFDAHFHEFLRVYIQPLQDKSFKDYDVYPPRTDQAFVVRYSYEDQRELKPHFDESTYTLNIALNTPNKDFTGGGCRFTRFNCSVVDTRLGWGFIHPGQFTHKHEGLLVTSGVRYIMVAFIDPDSIDD